MKQKNYNSDRNSAVGNIKRRPVQISCVKIKKINHYTQTNSVYQITDGSPEIITSFKYLSLNFSKSI